MSAIRGITQILPSTYSWKLGSGIWPGQDTSERFFVCRNKYEFELYLDRATRDSCYLFLRQRQKEDVSKIDALFILSYKYKTRALPVKNDFFRMCIVDSIDIRGLLEITCKFFTIHDRSGTIYEIDAIDGVDMQNKASVFEKVNNDEMLMEEITFRTRRRELYNYSCEVRQENFEPQEGCSTVIKQDCDFTKAEKHVKLEMKDETENCDQEEENAKELKREDEFNDAERNAETTVEDEKENNDVKNEISESKNQGKETDNEETDELDKSWTRHLFALSQDFEEVFLNRTDGDFLIRVGAQEYPTHKVILKARSPVFRAMLEHNMIEKIDGVIDIPDCDPLIFHDFLQYIYTGRLDTINVENVFELYRMSDKYDVKELKTDCVDFLMKNMSTDIICDIFSLATTFCESELMKRATEYFTMNAKDIITGLNWQNFAKENPVEANELFIKTLHRFIKN